MSTTAGTLPSAYCAWCRRWLGVEPVSVLFRARHISTVTGLRLADGREIVLKVRTAAPVHFVEEAHAAQFLPEEGADCASAQRLQQRRQPVADGLR